MLAKLTLIFRYYFSAIIAFLTCLAFTLLIYLVLKDRAYEQNQEIFNNKVVQAREALNKRVGHYIQILKGSKALFIASGEVSRAEWQNYVAALEIYKSYPGIQGIGFAQVVRPEELSSHIQQIRRSGFSGYTVRPGGRRTLYTPIIYIEPFTGRNLRAFGFDMFSEAVRRKAMEKARDSGQPALTGKVRLIQETDQDIQPGFLLYLPLYKNKILPATLAERRQLLTGFVYSPFRVKDLMQTIFDQNYQHLDIQIYAGKSVNKEALLFNTNQEQPAPTRKIGPAYQNVSHLQLPGNTWTLVVKSKPGLGASEGKLPDLVLVGGTIISFLVLLAMILVSDTRRSNRLKQIITDNATAALFMIDAKGYCTFMNPAAEKMTGFTFEEISRKPLHDMIHHTRPYGNYFPLQECPIDRALPTNYSMRAYEDTFIRKDGTFFQVSCAASPVFENEIPVSTVIEVRDITEERKFQVAVQESEARFRNMADNAPVLIWINDEQGQSTYVNNQWLRLTGQAMEEALGRGWLKTVHPEDLARVKLVYEDAYKQQIAYELDYRIRRYDGVYRWVAATATPRFDADGLFLGYIGSVIDITERKQAEQKIKENAELLHRIFLEVPAIVSLIRASDQVYILANPGFSKLHGNRPLLGKSIREANADLESQGFFEQIDSVIATGKPFVGQEVPVIFKNEDNPRTGYFNIVFQPLAAGNSQVASVLLFAVEVTELVLARKKLILANKKLNRVNTELRRTNTDLDNFVYTASHDLKAPIANLEGLINDLHYTLKGRLEEDEQFVLNLLANSVNKLKRTVADLAEITKVQKAGPTEQAEMLSFAEVLADVQTDLQPVINETGAQIQVKIEVPQLKYARKNLRSIVYNLLSNAIKYRSPDRVPEVNISVTDAGDYIQLAVEDNGLGIRADQQHKLFSMFKRVHTHVEGSGIGLYILKRIVENNGGYLKLISNAGQGSTFYVYLKK